MVFGSTDLAVAAVLAAYMAGLALGSAVMVRLIDKIKRPLLVYAVIEFFIALAALLVPLISTAMNRLQSLFLGVSELTAYSPLNSSLFYVFSSLVILLPPTFLMGATLPLLAKRLIRQDSQVGSRIGLLYMINTLGAAAGALITAFILLPQLGLEKTTWVAVLINLLAFLVAAARSLRDRSPKPASSKRSPQPIRTPLAAHTQNGWILPLTLISGFVSLSFEVVWTRLLGHILGGSIYAFGTMLAIFLTGLSIGAGVAARLAKNSQWARTGFAIVQICIALSFALAFAFAESIPRLTEGIDYGGVAFILFSLMVGTLSLLPGAVFIGATFPFAVRIHARNSQSAASASGRVYAWNTVGAIFGAVICGFVLLPNLQFAESTRLLLFCSLFLALFTAVIVRPVKRAVGITAVGLMMALALMPLNTPWQLLKNSPLTGRNEGVVEYFETGRSATVMLLTDPAGDLRLTTNGLPESVIQKRGARLSRYGLARWLTMLPVEIRPDARRMLIIGFGAGISVAAAPESLSDIDVIELEPAVIRANEKVARWREEDPLADTRVSVHVNDARSALKATDNRFDIVVSQPSHPWTSAASHLFTREFFSLVRERLSDDGVYVQWIGIQYLDESLLQTLLKTLQTSFEHVELYQPNSGSGLVFIASRQANAATQLNQQMLLHPEPWQLLGINGWFDLELARRLDSESARDFAGSAQISTDGKNLMQMRSPRVLSNSGFAANPQSMLAEFDPMLSTINQRDDLYIIRRLIQQNAFQRAKYLASHISDPVRQQTAMALIGLEIPDMKRQAKQTLRLLFRRQPTQSESMCALFLIDPQSVLERTASPALIEQLSQNPVPSLIIDGMVNLRLNQIQELKLLDQNLSGISVTHPLYRAAVRLRISWRQLSDSADEHRQALKMIDNLLAMQMQPSLLLLRASLATQSEFTDTAIASLNELAMLFSRNDRLQQRFGPATESIVNRLLNSDQIESDEASRLKQLLSSSVVKNQQ